MRQTRALLMICLCMICAAGYTSGNALADGTESLGVPADIAIVPGTGTVAGGTGLSQAQPGTITLDVPAGVTVKQVLLYWQDLMDTNSPGGETVLVNGISVIGQLIGGPLNLFNGTYSSAFRADITDLGLVGPGPNELVIDDVAFGRNLGAGCLVILDDGVSTAADIQLRDGMDYAYYKLEEPYKSMVPQTFEFAPSNVDRTVSLSLFFSAVRGDLSGGDFRPTTIEITNNRLPRKDWTVMYVDSEELDDENGAAENAFDGDPNTLWHTERTPSGVAPPHPHEIQIDLGDVYPVGGYEIGGFAYLPRQDGYSNGTVKDFRFYVAKEKPLTEADWGTPVAEGSFADDVGEKKIAFPAVEGRYIRLVALSSIDGNEWTSVAELCLLSPGGTTDVRTNLLDSNDGQEWDTLVLDDVVIPAGSSTLTVTAISEDREGTGQNPASFNWIAAALSLRQAPCIEIQKQVRWLTTIKLCGKTYTFHSSWHDADSLEEALKTYDSVEYRLVVRNCGDVQLDNVQVSDVELAISEVNIGSLAAGEEKILTHETPGFEVLLQKGKCKDSACYETVCGQELVCTWKKIQTCFGCIWSPVFEWQEVCKEKRIDCTFENTAAVTAEAGGIQVKDEDSAFVVCLTCCDS